MESNQLLVIDLKGSVGVVLEDDTIKQLEVGDIVSVGDIIVTADNSSIMIDVQGETLSIPANQNIKITPDLIANEARDSSETTVFDESLDAAIASLDQVDNTDSQTIANTDVTDFLDALEGDGDILDSLEATAAGGGGAAGSGGGNSFVQLTRIAESVDPNSVVFDSNFEANSTETFNLRDTRDGVVPDESLSSISLDELNFTNTSQPTITGTSESLVGETVNITVTDENGNEQIVTAVIASDGTFEITLPAPVVDGSISVVVEVTDPGGNTLNDTIFIEIDTTAPVISIEPVEDTNDTTPLLTGDVLGVPQGTEVSLVITDSNGNEQTVTTPTNAEGIYSVEVLSELSEGSFTVSASVGDEAGNSSTATTAGIIDLSVPSVTIESLGQSNDTTPTISGATLGLVAGSTVTVIITDSTGAELQFVTTTDDEGTWNLDLLQNLAEGEFTVVASVSDSAGNTAQDTQIGNIDLTPASISIDALLDLSDTTPSISGITNDAVPESLVTVEVVDSNGNLQTFSTAVNADGSWQVEVEEDLADGEFVVTASIIDTFGNEISATTTGVIDTSAPTITINNLDDIDNATPTISGSVVGEPEGTVVTIAVTDEAGNTQTITTQVQADGTFSVDILNELSEGEYTVDVSVVDSAGNTTTVSTSGEVDTIAPIVTIDALDSNNDTTPTISGTVGGEPEGTVVSITVIDSEGNVQTIETVVQADGTFSVVIADELSEGEFTVEVSVTDSAGNETTAALSGEVNTIAPTVLIDALGDTNDTTPTISGSVVGEPEGTVVTITVTDEAGNPQTITTEVQADGSFSVDVPNELSEGEFTVEVSVTDTAGNETTSMTTGEVDTAAPVVNIDPVGDTNDTTPTILGTATGEPEGTVVTITVTDEAGNPQTITTEVQADGTFSVDVPNELSEGEFTVEVSVTDSAGNETTATTTGEVDTTAPIVTINALGDTSDTTPVISGTVSGEPAGSTVTLTVTDANGVLQTITTQVIADGSWTVGVPAALAEGSYSVNASISDSAGNQGTANASGTIDTSTLTITIDVIGETNDQTPQISGETFNAQAGSSVNVQITYSAGAVITLTTTIDENGLWSVTPPADLAEGTISISATVTDLGGGSANAELDAVIDITPPTIQVNELGTSNDTTPVISGNTTGVVSGTVINLTVTDSQGVVRSFSATTDADGNWSVELSQELASGDYSVEAEVSDAAENSASTMATGNIDTSGPSLTVDFDTVTSDSTPTISGTSDAEVGTIITVVITDENGVKQTLTTTVDASGNWEVTPQTDLNEGDNTIEVSVSDEAGNITAVIDTITLDTQASTLTIQDVGDVNDLTPTLQGTSNEIGGTVTLTVTDSDGAVQTITSTVESDGHWDIEIPSAL
ncbi:retention module-containing protein, partial [Pseudoalteromonas aliena]|uniref:beta strand repeat-containing protein n=1 Tax=Pseudoalteromonas aliena TaxID=247523 RepID=UPI00311DB00A